MIQQRESERKSSNGDTKAEELTRRDSEKVAEVSDGFARKGVCERRRPRCLMPHAHAFAAGLESMAHRSRPLSPVGRMPSVVLTAPLCGLASRRSKS